LKTEKIFFILIKIKKLTLKKCFNNTVLINIQGLERYELNV
jgi:hypothetical protein